MKTILIKRILACITIGLILFFLEINITAQQQQIEEPKYAVNNNSDGACELNNAAIDQLVIEAKKSKERIFVISVLGKGETYRTNLARLGKARSVLTKEKQVPVSQIITAIREGLTEKTGKLEFYLGSQLFLVSEAEKNKMICLICCVIP